MKRPWLLTPKGQRASIHLANLISLVLFVAFVINFAIIEMPRTQISQLDPENVSYCEISACPKIQGLEITNGDAAVSEIQDRAFGYLLTLDFTNHQLLEGQRELWLKVESPDGRVLEMASVEIQMSLKNRTTAEFLLVSEKQAILGSKLLLGY